MPASSFTLKQTVGNPRIWAVSWSFFFVDIIRYGFLLWAPYYLFEVQKAGIEKAVYTAIAVPAFGIAGAIFSGWASDHWFQSRRPPIACILMGALGFLSIFFYYGVPQGAWLLSFVTLGLIGFCVLGTQVILIGAVPMDFGTRKAAGVGRRVHRFLRLYRRRHGGGLQRATSPTISAGRPPSGSGSSPLLFPQSSAGLCGNTGRLRGNTCNFLKLGLVTGADNQGSPRIEEIPGEPSSFWIQGGRLQATGLSGGLDPNRVKGHDINILFKAS